MVDPILVGSGLGFMVTAGGIIYPYFDLTKNASIKIRHGDSAFESVIDKSRKKHGLIITGKPRKQSDKHTHDNTSELVYNTLLERGFQKENLYILKGKNEPSQRLDCNTLPSDKKHLKEVLDHLYKEVTAKDFFFMYYLGHGGKTGMVLPVGQSKISLYQGTVRERELEELLIDLNPNHSVTYFNSCHSGGFSIRLGKGRNIAISTSKKNKNTYGVVGEVLEKKYGAFDSVFTLFFFSALRGKMPNGERVPFNYINKSIEDIFDYAADVQISAKGIRLGGIGKMTPHLVYGKINPKEVRL